MDTLPSAEFRRRYASLRIPTLVTVNGHVIGTWTPASAVSPMVAPVPVAAGFGRPQPAPKPGKR